MTDPIWRILREDGRYNLVWLARKTGYSHSHVKAVAAGLQPAGPKFRAACAALLERDESLLFYGNGHASVIPAPTADPVEMEARSG